MLVLTRGEDESIVLGEIIVRVVEIREDCVRLGIASPHTIPRYREVTLQCSDGLVGTDLQWPATPALTESEGLPSSV
jgi:carbon storage regulator CsrA